MEKPLIFYILINFLKTLGTKKSNFEMKYMNDDTFLGGYMSLATIYVHSMFFLCC